MARVRADKLREANAGHDGTWIAHPGLAAIARDAFDAVMKGPNQLQRAARAKSHVTAADLLQVPEGEITEGGLRNCIRVGVQYIEAWLRGYGCVPLYNLMEDAATAEICRAQLWQWLHHGRAPAMARGDAGALRSPAHGGARPHPRRGRRRDGCSTACFRPPRGSSSR